MDRCAAHAVGVEGVDFEIDQLQRHTLALDALERFSADKGVLFHADEALEVGLDRRNLIGQIGTHAAVALFHA